MWTAALAVAGAPCPGPAWAGQPPADRRHAAPKPDNAPYEASLRARLEELTRAFATAERPRDLTPQVEQLFDLTLAYATPAQDASLLADINSLRRQVRQLGTLADNEVAPTRDLLAKNPHLARAVALAVDPERDNVRSAYAIVRLLAEKFPERVLDKAAPASSGKPGARPRTPPARHGADKADFANLVAAFCTTYDGSANAKGPSINTERVERLFDHFTANAPRMAFGPQTPTALLAYVVDLDPRVTYDDLAWALRGYAGNRAVGKLYHTIVYDTLAFKRGVPKKVEQAPGGINLQNIRKYGGVCAEQAMFAANVGKAIGVPTVVVSARGSDLGHAWVGYLKDVGSNRHEWDFDEGRYKEYRDIRGDVIDPQSGKRIPDGYVGLTSGLLGDAGQIEATGALLDGADRLLAVEGARLAYPPAALPGQGPPATTARPLGRETRLALIETALRALPSQRRGWEMIADMARHGQLSADELKTWSERVLDLCGHDYPDFAFAALVPMIKCVQDTGAQDRLWEWAVGRFNKRKDLAAAAIIGRADMWEEAKQPDKAWSLYNDVIERYPNDGTIVVDALARAERFLRKEHKDAAVIDLYASAWGRITKPKDAAGEFTAGSNYVVVGRRYADLLQQAGKPIDAKKVRDAVQQVLDR